MDRLRCAEENLKVKRDELEEKTEMYETAQERVIELSGELNAHRMESNTASKSHCIIEVFGLWTVGCGDLILFSTICRRKRKLIVRRSR